MAVELSLALLSRPLQSWLHSPEASLVQCNQTKMTVGYLLAPSTPT